MVQRAFMGGCWPIMGSWALSIPFHLIHYGSFGLLCRSMVQGSKSRVQGVQGVQVSNRGYQKLGCLSYRTSEGDGGYRWRERLHHLFPRRYGVLVVGAMELLMHRPPRRILHLHYHLLNTTHLLPIHNLRCRYCCRYRHRHRFCYHLAVCICARVSVAVCCLHLLIGDDLRVRVPFECGLKARCKLSKNRFRDAAVGGCGGGAVGGIVGCVRGGWRGAWGEKCPLGDAGRVAAGCAGRGVMHCDLHRVSCFARRCGVHKR